MLRPGHDLHGPTLSSSPAAAKGYSPSLASSRGPGAAEGRYAKGAAHPSLGSGVGVSLLGLSLSSEEDEELKFLLGSSASPDLLMRMHGLAQSKGTWERGSPACGPSGAGRSEPRRTLDELLDGTFTEDMLSSLLDETKTDWAAGNTR